jgi:single-strand DNA-binding protein
MSLNKVTLIGNLGADPETRFLDSGQSVTSFSIATTKSYKDRDGQPKKDTQWHRISAWGKTGELCAKYLSKGRQVYLEGELRYREYTDKDGNKRTATDIFAQNVVFLSSGGGNGGGEQKKGAAKPEADHSGYDGGDDDVPF